MTLTSYISSGTVRIAGIRPMSETAIFLGQIFGVSFEPAEDPGPGYTTWIGKRGGLRYIFSSTRSSAHAQQEGAEQGEYELSVQSINSATGARELEIADYLVTRIRRDGRLNCWPDYRSRAVAR